MPIAPPRAGFFPRPMLVLLVLLATTPLWLPRVGLYQYLALEVMIWMLFALGYNLMLGTTGLPSFGHGAFFGAGAYAFGLLQQRVLANVWFDLVGAVLIAAALGALVGACIAHKRGIYFALLTIAFGQVFWFVAVKWHGVTGGEDGLQNIVRAPLSLGVTTVDLRSNEALFYFCLALFAVALVVLWRLVHSPFGRVLAAIRQNEVRAAFVGYNVWLYKWLVITIASGFAGLAGAMFALAQQSAYPNVMSLHSSGFVVMMVLIGGGLVSFWGPAIGALFFILARDVLGAATETWLLWYGLLFVVMVLWKPEGIAGLWQEAMRRRAASRATRHWPEERCMALFEAVGLHKRFGDQVVLQDLSLSFEEGRLSGIMGPNGAGKTTCFNVLTGRHAPDRGRVTFAGADITGLPPRLIARKGISRSFQVMNLFNDDSAIDNVLVSLPRVRRRGFDAWRDLRADSTAEQEAAAVLARVGLAGKERAAARDLSYGERRALEIAVALAAQPRLLFLDEPTAGLGAQATGRLADLVGELKRALTIVIIEHDMRFLFRLADTVSVLHWGQVIAAGTPAELRENQWVQRSSLAAEPIDA